MFFKIFSSYFLKILIVSTVIKMIEKIFITRGNEFSKFELKNKLIISENKKNIKK